MATQTTVSHPQPPTYYLDPGIAAMGGVLFSVIVSTVTISFFLSGLKQAISEVNARITQLALENKSMTDQLTLRINYREQEVTTLSKKLEALQREINSLTKYLNTEMNAGLSHSYRHRTEPDED